MLDTETRETLETLNKASRQLGKLFMAKYYDYKPLLNNVRVVASEHRDVCGMWVINSEVWSLSDMMVALEYNADKKTLME